jgi:hypothetical protein
MCTISWKKYTNCDCQTKSHVPCIKYDRAPKSKIDGQTREPEMKNCPDFKLGCLREALVIKGTCGMISGGLCPYVEEKKIAVEKLGKMKIVSRG